MYPALQLVMIVQWARLLELLAALLVRFAMLVRPNRAPVKPNATSVILENTSHHPGLLRAQIVYRALTQRYRRRYLRVHCVMLETFRLTLALQAVFLVLLAGL
jgi:hypothetical protein